MGLQTMLLSLDFFDHLNNHIFSTLMRFEVGYLRHVCPFGHTKSSFRWPVRFEGTRSNVEL